MMIYIFVNAFVCVCVSTACVQLPYRGSQDHPEYHNSHRFAHLHVLVYWRPALQSMPSNIAHRTHSSSK